MSILHPKFMEYLQRNNIYIKTYDGFKKDLHSRHGYWELTTNDGKDGYGRICYTIYLSSNIIKISLLSSSIKQFQPIGHILPFIMLCIVFTLSDAMRSQPQHYAVECPYETSHDCFVCSQMSNMKCVLCECRDKGIHYTDVLNTFGDNKKENDYKERFIKLHDIFFYQHITE